MVAGEGKHPKIKDEFVHSKALCIQQGKAQK